MPEAERLFVEFALRWVANHNRIHGSQGMPCDLPIKAVEASVLDMSGNQNEYFYDRHTLREVCGCLISVRDETYYGQRSPNLVTMKSVTFAHYTVREYLDSKTAFHTSLSRFVQGGERMQDQLTNIMLSKAQELKSNQAFEHGVEGADTREVFREVYSDFTFYCVLSSLLIIRDPTDHVFSPETSKDLAIALLDPSRPAYTQLEIAAATIQRATAIFDSFTSITSNDWSYWNAEWDARTNNVARHLYNLIFLESKQTDNSNFPDFPLSKAFLKGKDLRGLLCGQLTFVKEEWLPVRRDRFVFEGSIVEVVAQSAAASSSLKFLLEVGAGFFDPSAVLFFYLSQHYHKWCEGRCPLQRLLDLGANPNQEGYRSTPLQIATYLRDSVGVEALLKAGASPNGIGDPSGRIWPVGSVMCYYNHLHGSSPLRICNTCQRKLVDIQPPNFREIQEHKDAEWHKIEILLKQYGAMSFSKTSDFDCLQIERDRTYRTKFELDGVSYNVEAYH